MSIVFLCCYTVQGSKGSRKSLKQAKKGKEVVTKVGSS
jgi:hypothetical protein